MLDAHAMEDCTVHAELGYSTEFLLNVLLADLSSMCVMEECAAECINNWNN